MRLSTADHPISWLKQRRGYLHRLLLLTVGIGLAGLSVSFTPLTSRILWLAILVLLMLFHRLQKPHLFGAIAWIGLIWAGMWLTLEDSKRGHSLPDEEADYRLMLTDTPQRRGEHLCCEAQVQMAVQGAEFKPVDTGTECLLYLPADSAARTLRLGDCLWVHADIEMLQGKGWCFVRSDSWRYVGKTQHPTWRMRATEWRRQLADAYGQWGFSHQVQAVLSALTLGDKRNLDNDLTADYRLAGAAHVLALSGLHVGLLALLVVGVLTPLLRFSGWLHQPVRFLAIVILWLYVWLTGSPPSALRATMFFTLLLWAAFPMRQRLNLEVLLATAFWMLVCCPKWLFDIGFQLSFTAVAALLLLHPLLAALWVPSHSYLRAPWQLITTTLAAQAGTAPLVAAYFGSLPVHFLFTSLWVVPWTSLLLLCTVILWLLTPLSDIAQGWAHVLQQLVEMQHIVLRQIAHWPMSTLGPLYVNKVSVVLAYACLAAVGWLLYRRTWRALLPCIGCALLLIGYGAWQEWENRPQRSLSFYNVRSTPSIYCLADDGRSWIACTDSLTPINALERTPDARLRKRYTEPPLRLPQHYEADGLHWAEGLLTYAGCRVCLLSDGRWQGMKAESPLQVDYLLVCRGYWGSISELTSLFQIGKVVLHPSLSRRRQGELAAECQQLGLPFHVLARQGTLHVPLL